MCSSYSISAVATSATTQWPSSEVELSCTHPAPSNNARAEFIRHYVSGAHHARGRDHFRHGIRHSVTTTKTQRANGIVILLRLLGQNWSIGRR